MSETKRKGLERKSTAYLLNFEWEINRPKLTFAQMVGVCNSMTIEEHARELSIELTDPENAKNIKAEILRDTLSSHALLRFRWIGE